MNLDVGALIDEAFQNEITRRVEQTGVPTTEWRAAGRKSREWPNKEDLSWWTHHAPEMVQDYIKWRNEGEEKEWRIWEPYPGDPAIEMGVLAPIGGVTVKGFLDRVFATPSGELVIVDVKTGSRTPDSDLQLGFYACLLEVGCGIRPQWGAYYKAREGRLHKPLVNLDHFSTDLLGGFLRDFVRAREQGIYLPVLGGHCRTCGVANQCAAFNGEQADRFDPHHPEYRRNVDG